MSKEIAQKIQERLLGFYNSFDRAHQESPRLYPLKDLEKHQGSLIIIYLFIEAAKANMNGPYFLREAKALWHTIHNELTRGRHKNWFATDLYRDFLGELQKHLFSAGLEASKLQQYYAEVKLDIPVENHEALNRSVLEHLDLEEILSLMQARHAHYSLKKNFLIERVFASISGIKSRVAVVKAEHHDASLIHSFAGSPTKRLFQEQVDTNARVAEEESRRRELGIPDDTLGSIAGEDQDGDSPDDLSDNGSVHADGTMAIATRVDPRLLVVSGYTTGTLWSAPPNSNLSYVSDGDEDGAAAALSPVKTKPGRRTSQGD